MISDDKWHGELDVARHHWPPASRPRLVSSPCQLAAFAQFISGAVHCRWPFTLLPLMVEHSPGRSGHPEHENGLSFFHAPGSKQLFIWMLGAQRIVPALTMTQDWQQYTTVSTLSESCQEQNDQNGSTWQTRSRSRSLVWRASLWMWPNCSNSCWRCAYSTFWGVGA